MSLRERLRGTSALPSARKPDAFTRFGVIDNPFPAAGQTSGHPRLEDDADTRIAEAVREFETPLHPSQVLVLRGTQGVGKTNFLGAYEGQLRSLYEQDSGYYVIRYFADPEPAFDAVLRSVLAELGTEHLRRVAQELASIDVGKRTSLLLSVRSVEARAMFQRLASEADRSESLELALEWLLGLRILKRHREKLGVSYRLDTVESRTQALRDLVYVSAELGLLNGLYLLMDELEKQAGTLSKNQLTRYLFALRALIDALPSYLFLILAMTPAAFSYYNRLIPSVTSRLQTTIDLRPIANADAAVALYRFYLDRGREHAREAELTLVAAEGRTARKAGEEDPFREAEVRAFYAKLADRARMEGVEGGVLHRDFLQQLHRFFLEEVGDAHS